MSESAGGIGEPSRLYGTGKEGFATRPVVTGRKAVVTAGHYLAAQAGMQVIHAGGNAMDAAVATSLSMGVAAPYGSGVGGKLVMLYREAATGKVHCLEAVCTSPAMAMPPGHQAWSTFSLCVLLSG